MINDFLEHLEIEAGRSKKTVENYRLYLERFATIVEEIVNSRMLRREILPIRVLPSCSSPDATVLAAADVAFGRFLMV